MKISQLCATYDEAQNASRDPRQREQQDHYLRLTFDYRRLINQEVRGQMQVLSEVDVTIFNAWTSAIAELTYFNTWLALRGGWEGFTSS